MHPRPSFPLTASIAFALAVAVLGVGASSSPAAEAAVTKTCRRGPQLDTKERVTFTGKVVEVVDEPGAGSTLLLDKGGETLRIHLGPQGILAQQGLTLAAGDAVTGEAFSGSCRGEGLTARLVEKSASHQKVELRDEAGVPRWQGEQKGWAHRSAGESARGCRRGEGPTCGARGGHAGHGGRGGRCGHGPQGEDGNAASRGGCRHGQSGEPGGPRSFCRQR